MSTLFLVTLYIYNRSFPILFHPYFSIMSNCRNPYSVILTLHVHQSHIKQHTYADSALINWCEKLTVDIIQTGELAGRRSITVPSNQNIEKESLPKQTPP